MRHPDLTSPDGSGPTVAERDWLLAALGFAVVILAVAAGL